MTVYFSECLLEIKLSVSAPHSWKSVILEQIHANNHPWEHHQSIIASPKQGHFSRWYQPTYVHQSLKSMLPENYYDQQTTLLGETASSPLLQQTINSILSYFIYWAIVLSSFENSRGSTKIILKTVTWQHSRGLWVNRCTHWIPYVLSLSFRSPAIWVGLNKRILWILTSFIELFLLNEFCYPVIGNQMGLCINSLDSVLCIKQLGLDLCIKELRVWRCTI